MTMISSAMERSAGQRSTSRAMLMPAPTVMKNRPKKQAFEGFEVGFEFMPEFGRGKDNPGEERAKGGREADKRHQEGNADDDHQGQRRVHFAQTRGVDEAEDGARGEDAEQDHKANRRDSDQRDTPEGQALDKVQRCAMMVARMLSRTARDRAIRIELRWNGSNQQGQGREDRNHGDVLRQEHGKDTAPATGLHQAFFRKCLQDDGGG